MGCGASTDQQLSLEDSTDQKLPLEERTPPTSHPRSPSSDQAATPPWAGETKVNTYVKVEDPVLEFGKRPERQGKWFTVHKSLLDEIDYSDICDIHDEFLKYHPNGGEATAGFVSILLSDEQIEQQRDRIRITSYRWAGFDGVGAKGDQFVLPGNYLWFLDFARDRKLILWMDWMANVGVNVPVPEVINYMGSLYAENTVLGEWMFDLDKLSVGLTRAWIFQEMAFGPLDKEAMGGLFERLRELGRAVANIPVAKRGEYSPEKWVTRRNKPQDFTAVQAYIYASGCVASLLNRRAFGVVAANSNAKWFSAIHDGHPSNDVAIALGIEYEAALKAVDYTRAKLPGIDQETWSRILLLFSTQKGYTRVDPEPRKDFDWTDKAWNAHRHELVELVCAEPYHSCKSVDELVERYDRGVLGAALGCQVTMETDRPEAVTSVLRAVASTKFKQVLSAEDLIQWAWKSVLGKMAAAKYDEGMAEQPDHTFIAKVHAPVTANSESIAIGPLQLHGTEVTYDNKTNKEQNDPNLKCRYTAEDGSSLTFNGFTYSICPAVQAAGLRGIVCNDVYKGLPKKPLPKPQDENGTETDICLCVPRAELFAKIARGFTFTILTQPWEGGNRVIALYVVSKKAAQYEGGGPNVEKKPPKPDIHFYG